MIIKLVTDKERDSLPVWSVTAMAQLEWVPTERAVKVIVLAPDTACVVELVQSPE